VRSLHNLRVRKAALQAALKASAPHLQSTTGGVTIEGIPLSTSALLDATHNALAEIAQGGAGGWHTAKKNEAESDLKSSMDFYTLQLQANNLKGIIDYATGSTSTSTSSSLQLLSPLVHNTRSAKCVPMSPAALASQLASQQAVRLVSILSASDLPLRIKNQATTLESASRCLQTLEKKLDSKGKFKAMSPGQLAKALCIRSNSLWREIQDLKYRLTDGSSKSDAEHLTHMKNKQSKVIVLLNAAIQQFNAIWNSVQFSDKPESPTHWRVHDSPQNVVPEFRLWPSDSTPAHHFPPTICGVQINTPPSLHALLLARDYSRRAAENVVRSFDDVLNVCRNLKGNVSSLECIRTFLNEPSNIVFNSSPFDVRATLLTLASIGKGEGGHTHLALPSAHHLLHIRQLNADSLLSSTSSSKQAEIAVQAAVFLSRDCQGPLGIHTAIMGSSASLGDPLALPSLPCQHRVATLNYNMNRLMSGDMDPSAWSTSARRFNSVLQGKPCKCVDTQEVATEEDEQVDEDAAAMEEEGEGRTRREELGNTAIGEDDDDGDEAEGLVGDMGRVSVPTFIPTWASSPPPPPTAKRSREKPAVTTPRVTRSHYFHSGSGGGGKKGGGEGEPSTSTPSTSL